MEINETTYSWILDQDNASCVAKYNTLLATLDHLIPREVVKCDGPVFIIGAPRSGTTFVYQLIAYCLNIAYINNFIARFWDAPCVGTYISEKILKLRPMADYKSDLGRTSGLSGVHEYGNYWRRYFPSTETDYANSMNENERNRLKSEICGMSAIAGRRIVFKNLTCGLRIVPLVETFPNAVFIVVKRDMLENGLSILKARRRYRGSENEWWSLRPKRVHEYCKLSVSEQIKCQIESTYEEMEAQLRDTGARSILLNYEEVCEDPVRTIKMLSEALGVNIVNEPEDAYVPTSHLPTNNALEQEMIRVIGG